MRRSSAKVTVLANYVSQAWISLMSLALIPMYIRYMGIEAYGLLGFFSLLLTLLQLLDLGMSPTLSREMARYSASPETEEGTRGIRNLLRTVEVLCFLVAAVLALTLWLLSPWFASSWLTAKTLPEETLQHAVAIMGLVTAMRFFESIYSGALVGLQHQVLLGAVSALLATVRGLGAIAVLIWISPTITAFFIWQGVVSALSVLLLAGALYVRLPATSSASRFSLSALRDIRKFAAGMALMGIVSLFLMQTDKILLSKMLGLADYGHYILAFNVATLLYTIVAPICQAFFPRFSQAVARGDRGALILDFHKAAQLVTVLVGAIAAMLIFFGQPALALWTRDEVLAAQVAPLLMVQALGIFLHCLMWVPYQLQLAHGIVDLTLKSNLVAIVLVVPAIFWAVSLYGPMGAAWVWVALNVGYLTITANLMFGRIVSTERLNWFLRDLALPSAIPFSLAFILSVILPSHQQHPILEFATLASVTTVLLAFAAVLAPHVLHQLSALVRRGSTPALERQ